MKRRMGIGQLISFIGTLTLSIGLILNGFDIISLHAFRAIVFAGVGMQIVALVFILKRDEF